jgi:trigger factor
MNITQEKIDDLNAVVNVNISPGDYAGRVEKAIKDHAKKAKLPGFRPGMVPPSHIKKMYGRSILVDEVNTLLSDSLNNYLTENNIEVLGQPLPKPDGEREFKWDGTDEFRFDYEVGLAPQFTLDLSSKDRVPFYKIAIDEETLAERMKNLRRSYGKMTNPDVSAENDVLYAGLVQLSPDGSVFEGGISNTASVRLELVTDEKIKKSLTGLKKEDVVDVDIQAAFSDAATIAKILNIPEDDAAALKSNFRLTVKNVNRLEEADLDQEFFDKLFGKDSITTEEQFKERVRSEQEDLMVQNAERRLQQDLYEFVLGKISFELPDEFLKRWLKVTNEKLSEEELNEGYGDFAKNLKWTLIENKIIKDNSIEIKYEDVFHAAKQRIDAQFRMYSPQALSEEQLSEYTVQFLQNKESANKVFEEVKALKVFDYLKETVTLDTKEIEYRKFLELA